jgi:hypothetical protein
MRRLLAASTLLALLTLAGPLHADMWECTEPDGSKRFTNVKADSKGCRQLTVTPAVVVPPPPPATAPPTRNSDARPPSPESFPKVAPQVQQQRDNDRRKILETELVNEERNLQEARRELNEQENTRLGSERNAQRVIDRIDPYQKKVKLHEDNIANLRRELSNLR